MDFLSAPSNFLVQWFRNFESKDLGPRFPSLEFSRTWLIPASVKNAFREEEPREDKLAKLNLINDEKLLSYYDVSKYNELHGYSILFTRIYKVNNIV